MSVKSDFFAAFDHTKPQLCSLKNTDAKPSRKRRRDESDDKWEARAQNREPKRQQTKRAIAVEQDALRRLLSQETLCLAEEQELKRLQRKQKNREAAQMSREKKKEKLDLLEKRIQHLASENNNLKTTIDDLHTQATESQKLEAQNADLKAKLAQLEQENELLKESKRSAERRECEQRTNTISIPPLEPPTLLAPSNNHVFNVDEVCNVKKVSQSASDSTFAGGATDTLSGDFLPMDIGVDDNVGGSSSQLRDGNLPPPLDVSSSSGFRKEFVSPIKPDFFVNGLLSPDSLSEAETAFVMDFQQIMDTSSVDLHNGMYSLESVPLLDSVEKIEPIPVA